MQQFSSKMQSQYHGNLPAVLICLASWVLTIPLGCHRQHYRKQADAEVYHLIDQKSASVARPPNTAFRIEVDRESRMFNPFDLDFQPMPLDDPASYQLMQCVDGRRGYPMWEAAGFTNTTESPDWWQFLPLDEDGVLELDLEKAVQIALLHSPEYQTQLEQLYLSALAVSAQRFEFDTQFFGGLQTVWTAIGRRQTGSSQSNVSLGPFSGNGNNNLRMTRSFATGADLVVSVANSIVWQVSGPNTQSAPGMIDFSLVQPLLRNAGRDVVLENLTEAERDLLAQVRSLERFRRSFFLNITVGRSLESQIANPNDNPLSATASSIPAALGGAGNYLGLLQSRLQIRNLEENIVRQTENLLNFEDALIELLTTIPDDTGSIVQQRLLIAQARESLLNSQSGLVNQQAAYEQSVDAFLRTLGLPPYLCVRLNDPILERFELVDKDLLKRREQLSTLRNRVGELNVQILDYSKFSINEESQFPTSELEWTDEISRIVAGLREELEPLADFSKQVTELDLPAIKQDIEVFVAAIPKRSAGAKSLQDFYEEEKSSICGLLNLSDIDVGIFELDELDDLNQTLNEAFAQLEERFENYQQRTFELIQRLETISEEAAQLDKEEIANVMREDVILASQRLLSNLGDDVLSLQLIQARTRTESVLLPEVEMDPEIAFSIAKRNRRDYANAKTALVDAWREIEVAADDLESTLDVVVNGGVGSNGNNPFRLRSSSGQLSVGLLWDAPITRLLERNEYRSQLINFERQRRNFYQFEDSLWQLLRAEIRQLQANRLTFELGRRSIRIAVRQIELNADIRALDEARGRGAGPTAARDTINAINSLLVAQNVLLGIFVDYEVVRRSLDFDLGTMELTPEGLWIDPEVIRAEELVGLPGTTADGLPLQTCNECCLPTRLPPTEPSFDDPLNAQQAELHNDSPLKEPVHPEVAQEFERLELVPLGLSNPEEVKAEPVRVVPIDPSTLQ